ncbi:MAG: hypothetical protein CVV44_08210 [Spirochaetae bacterium HGW-Spirochaetae-1]|jgi:DNA-binding MarR family transcriptional regulator|nr:MAG: hypothetical protein CVV44_08210 [Spirochaetae bacterium HGW-Spirochaetae-1]
MSNKQNKYTLVELIEMITAIIGDIEVQFIKSLGDAGLTARQLAYLEVINRLGHPNFSELARELSLSKPSVTAIIEKFTAQNYVERVTSDEDRRTAHIHLTKKGYELVAMHERTHLNIAEIFSSNLGRKDLDTLVEILNTVVSKSAKSISSM